MGIQESELRASAQRALLADVCPSVLAILVGLNESTLKFWAYVEGQLAETERDDLEAAVTRMIADHLMVDSLDFQVFEHCEQPIKDPGFGLWVSVRYQVQVVGSRPHSD
jgi:hypothetical protein